MPMILEIIKKIPAWFFPPTCILCRHPSDRSQDLCHGCLMELPILPQSCPRCAKSLPTPLTTVVCGACLRQPPPFDNTFALFSYRTPITKLIMELKFHQRLVHARVLGELMATALQQKYGTQPLPSRIIPVPLHVKRLQERGFNQALEIARPVATLLKIPLDTTSCLRSKHTAAQAQLTRLTRQQNMKNAFKIQEDMSNKHVAVLDDVVTTGQTIGELCKVLRAAGAARIDVWCCAKA